MAASEDFMTVNSCILGEDDANENDDQDQHHPQRTLSRLSLSTSCDDDDDGGDTVTRVSLLSMESFEGDADGEFSSGSSDSDKDTAGCFSLPMMSLRQGKLTHLLETKEYCRENEVKCRRRRKNSRGIRERWVERAKKYEAMNNKAIGDSECILITKPLGSRRSICMDIDEIRACRDLGFELEHERLVDLPRRNSMPTIDTSSGGNSPIATWRISSPGDDPREVKARLRAWAQAVALASAARPLNR